MRSFLYCFCVMLFLFTGQISVWCADTSEEAAAQTEQELKPVAANMDLWPDSWKAYYSHFQNYVVARRKFWPQPKIRFQKPFQLKWEPIVSKEWGSFTHEQKDGLQLFRHGRHSLSISSDGMNYSLQSLYQGDYVASVWRFVGGYQHLSPPFFFRVISEKVEEDDKQKSRTKLDRREDGLDVFVSDKNESGDKFRKRIELIQPKFKGELFPNQWWYDHADYHIWSTSDLLANEFFKHPRPFNPSITLEEFGENEKPAVKRNLLSPELESLLELRLYYEGLMVKQVSAANVQTWTFEHGPGHYVFLLVAPDSDGGAHIVSRPFQTWFPDEGDGVLRRVPMDADKDGIPDYWEKWYNLDPKDPKDADKPAEGNSGPSNRDCYQNKKQYQMLR